MSSHVGSLLRCGPRPQLPGWGQLYPSWVLHPTGRVCNSWSVSVRPLPSSALSLSLFTITIGRKHVHGGAVVWATQGNTVILNFGKNKPENHVCCGSGLWSGADLGDNLLSITVPDY